MLRKHVFGISIIITAFLANTAGLAKSVNIRTQTLGSGFNYVFTEDALMDMRFGDSGWVVGASYDYLKDALVKTNADHSRETGVVISSLQTLESVVTYRANRRLMFGLSAPFHMVQPVGTSNRFALGDIKPFIKYRLTPSDTASTAVAMMIESALPTGQPDYYLSDQSLVAGLRFIVEQQISRLNLAVNAGVRYAYNSQVSGQDLSYKTRIPLSFSALYSFGPRWAINGEVGGSLNLPANQLQNPGEGYLGGQFFPVKNLMLSAGGGVGNVTGVGSNDYRIVAGMRLALSSEREAVLPVRITMAPPVVERVRFTPKKILITEEVKFETARDVLSHSGKNLLDEVAVVIKNNLDNFKTITVGGHTDPVGSDKYNMNLSNARNASVVEYLTGRGVAANRLTSIGYGERQPKVVSKLMSQAGRNAVNRRVEFKVVM